MRGTQRYVAGSRFKYTPDSINFSYEDLVDAIGDAIDKQAAEDGNEFFTDQRNNLYTEVTEELDFDTLMERFTGMIEQLQTKENFSEYYAPRIEQITDRYLGKGNKVSNCSREQVEALDLIVSDLSELVSQS